MTRMGPIVRRGGCVLGSRSSPSAPTAVAGRKPTAAANRPPVRSVMIDRRALADIADHGFDGLESVFALFGVTHPDGAVQVMFAADVSAERTRETSSVQVSFARLAGWNKRIAGIRDCELIGDLHIHPRDHGTVANPSRADLKWWRSQLARSSRPFWIGAVAQRPYDADAAWLTPTVTTFVIWKDDAGRTDCCVLDAELEPRR